MLFDRAREFDSRIAIVTPDGASSYGDLLQASARVASLLLDGQRDLLEERVAFLVPPGFDYVATQWGIWRAGGVAVPLGLSHPPPELQYVLEDAEPRAVIAHSDFRDRLEQAAATRNIRLWNTVDALAASSCPLPSLDESRRAMILYTSGTTSRPKGVVTTHANVRAQVESLLKAWEWTADDSILNVLPLHHVHGIINVLTCALWSGARCEFLTPFDADLVLDRFAQGDLTLFMAVPTIYAKLIAAWEQLAPPRQQAVTAGCGRMRLMVSGSAALPVSTLERWREISGHVLLERYGMTEIGMALSNPLHGERRPGRVGIPLPGVSIRRVDETGDVLQQPDVSGELEVRGPAVFREYWRRPGDTAAAFRDGWFRTGDVAIVEDGSFRLLGRTSVDIIKTGGYKVSALEIEEVLRTHPGISECAVVGVPDDEWGEIVAACVVCSDRSATALKLKSLRAWGKARLAPYKVPQRLLLVDDLPRNAMGKVQKVAVKALFDSGAPP